MYIKQFVVGSTHLSHISIFYNAYITVYQYFKYFFVGIFYCLPCH